MNPFGHIDHTGSLRFDHGPYGSPCLLSCGDIVSPADVQVQLHPPVVPAAGTVAIVACVVLCSVLAFGAGLAHAASLLLFSCAVLLWLLHGMLIPAVTLSVTTPHGVYHSTRSGNLSAEASAFAIEIRHAARLERARHGMEFR